MPSNVRELHDAAMKYAQEAMMLKEGGHHKMAVDLYKDAFNKEKEAAFLLKKVKDSEPTRSILFRSAASLAYQAEKYPEASRMVGEGLSGYPPKRVFRELNIINEKIKLAFYNLDNSLSPNSEGFVFHLVGNSIDYGSIPHNALIERIDSVQKLLRKTANKILGLPFSSRKDFLIPNFHTPKPGSFSIEISVSVRENENHDLVTNPSDVIDEYLYYFDLLENLRLDELSKRIDDKSYLNYFISQSKKIAPDGDSVTGIDFIGSRRSVTLSRRASEIPIYSITEDNSLDKDDLNEMEIIGTLNFATSRRGEAIGVVDNTGKNFTVSINEGLSEYVRSYFDKKVKVTGMGKDSKLVEFMSIDEIAE